MTIHEIAVSIGGALVTMAGGVIAYAKGHQAGTGLTPAPVAVVAPEPAQDAQEASAPGLPVIEDSVLPSVIRAALSDQLRFEASDAHAYSRDQSLKAVCQRVERMAHGMSRSAPANLLELVKKEESR